MATERKILANPDEPSAGDYAFKFYDNTHPINGNPSDIESMRQQLRGFRGKSITLTVRGARIDDDGTVRRFTARREFVLHNYSDIFGPGSAYLSVIKAVRERHSDETLVVYSLLLQAA